MNVWPVIVRELRQQARQKFTFTLRGVGAGLMTIAAALFSFQFSFGPYLGGWLFAGLHITLFYVIWVLVPLSASDCISRERREGTLGLLFLTPLRAREIVMAKALAHGLRAMTLLLAVLPVLTIPFILGGVSWQQASMSALVNFSAVCWALAAALVASAGTRSSLRALVGAVTLTICAIMAHAFTLGALTSPGIFFSGNMLGFLDERLLYGMSPMGMNQVRAGGGMIRGGAGTLLHGAVQGALVALLVLYGAILFAAARVRRTWREEPPPQWVQNMQRTFFTPVLWRGFFKRWMRWKIERNPVGWLEQRTWTGRLVTWTWFAIVISLYSAIFTDRNFFRNFSGMQMTMAWLIMGSIAASAAGSFRRERESGVLELLLVTPLSAAHIIGGRLRGLWGQFLPAVATLLVIWMYFQSIFRRYDELGKILFFGATFFTLPVLGLYFSLLCRSFIAAFLATLATGLLLPMLLERLAALWWWANVITNQRFDPSFGARPGAVIFQAGLAVGLLYAMRRRLEGRQFPLERTGQ